MDSRAHGRTSPCTLKHKLELKRITHDVRNEISHDIVITKYAGRAPSVLYAYWMT